MDGYRGTCAAAALVNEAFRLVMDGIHLKVYGWYDNEWGYSCPMADLACAVSRWTGHWAGTKP